MALDERLCSPFKDADGRLTEWLGMNFDIKVRKMEELALKRKEQLLELALTAAGAGTWSFNISTNSFKASGRTKQLYGLCPQLSMTSDQFVDALHGDDCTTLCAAIKRAGDCGEPFQRNVRIPLTDGSNRWLSVTGERFIEAGRKVIVGLVQDITERIELELKLKESEERYRSFFTTVAMGTVIVASDGRILDANDRFCQITGYARDELIGKLTVRDLTYEGEREQDWHTASRYFAGELPTYIAEKRYRRKDGSICWIRVNAAAIKDKCGVIIRSAGVVEDITASKRALDTLRNSEERYRTLVEKTGAVTWSCPPSGKNMVSDPSWMLFSGQTNEEAMGDGWSRVLHPDDVNLANQRWREALTRGEALRTELRFRRRDGEWRWMDVSGVPVKNTESEIVEWIGINTDITERKEAEVALQQFRNLAETSAQFIGLCGLDLLPTFINAAGLEMVGLESMEEARKIPIFEFFDQADREDYRTRIFPALVRDGQIAVEVRFRNFATGVPFWVHHTVNALKNHQGQVTGYATVTFDLTESRRSRAALLEQEKKYGAFVTAFSDVIFRLSPDWTTLYELRGNGLIADTREPTTGWLDKYIPQAEEAVFINTLRRAVERKYLFALEHRLLTVAGSAEWFETRAAPILDDNGDIVEWIGTSKHVGVLRQAQDELRQSEERLRLALGAGKMAVWDWHLETDTVLWNEEHYKILGYEPHSLTPSYRAWIDRVLPADALEVEAAIRQCLEAGSNYTAQFRVLGLNDEERWVEAHGRIERYPNLKPQRLYGVIFDITERKRTESYQRYLLTEVNHRSKNLLSVILAIAQQTAHDEKPSTFYSNFAGRLKGLAASQDLLVESEWQGVALAALVNSQLQHIEKKRLRVEGPECYLLPSAAQTIGMSLHELGTNAIKYEALLKESGTIDLSWKIRPAGPASKSHLVISWSENCGEPILRPSHKGFGYTVTVEMPEHLLGAKVELSFPTGGVNWTLEVPIENILEQKPTQFGNSECAF